MLRHIRLLVFDLDYAVFDCSVLKIRALRQSLISFGDGIPQAVRLPDEIDAEEGYREHGFRWTQFLEIGLDEEKLAQLQHAYKIHEGRLLEASVGSLFPGVLEVLAACRRRELELALGAESSRDYLLAVCDRHRLYDSFDTVLCTEEFGVGSADEMLAEIMHHHDVTPSETLVLGTRPAFFHAAHNVDVISIGCGWGVHRHGALADADIEAPTLANLSAAIRKADDLSAQYMA